MFLKLLHYFSLDTVSVHFAAYYLFLDTEEVWLDLFLGMQLKHKKVLNPFKYANEMPIQPQPAETTIVHHEQASVRVSGPV